MKQGILNVKVLIAMNLKTKSSSGACDPYVTEGWPSFKKTTIKRNNLNPKWYEEFNLAVKHADEESLKIFVHNGEKGEDRCDECLGNNIVRLKDITPEESNTLTINLLSPGRRDESSGEVKIEMVYKPFALDQIPSDIYVEGILKVIIHKGEKLNHTNPLVM
ncbi:synaptotagmin-1-like protein isoform X2 [Tanacetum coccineum]